MIKFNNEQLKLLAGFTSNLGVVFIAGVITPLFSNIDGLTPDKVVLGLVASIISLALSLSIAGLIKR